MKTVKEILDEIDRELTEYDYFALAKLKSFILSDSETPKDCNHEWSGTEWDYCIKCKYEKPVPGQECEHEWESYFASPVTVWDRCKKCGTESGY
jgi:hypothetical protein